jgi:hypothetical protein
MKTRRVSAYSPYAVNQVACGIKLITRARVRSGHSAARRRRSRRNFFAGVPKFIVEFIASSGEGARIYREVIGRAFGPGMRVLPRAIPRLPRANRALPRPR